MVLSMKPPGNVVTVTALKKLQDHVPLKASSNMWVLFAQLTPVLRITHCLPPGWWSCDPLSHHHRVPE
jgi:hypothetical protein